MIRFETTPVGDTSPVNEVPTDVIYAAKIHWISYVKPVIVGVLGLPFILLVGVFGLMGIAVLLLGLYLFIYKGIGRILELKKTRILVSPTRLTVITGIFTKNVEDISLYKSKTISFHKSLLGQLLDFGRFSLSTGEHGKSLIVSAPEQLRRAITAQINNMTWTH